MIILPFTYITDSTLLFVWSILCWCIAVLVFLIEFPIFARCISADSIMGRMLKTTRLPLFRGISYGIFGIVLALSIGVRFSSLSLPALLLLIAGTLNGVSLWKREEFVETCLKGGASRSEL